MKRFIGGAGLIAFSETALAHTGLLATDGFSHGFLHPFLGLDHFLAMLGLGLWASTQTRLLARQAIGVFLLFMTLGALFGLAGFGFAYVETAIVVSLLLVGITLSFPLNSTKLGVQALPACASKACTPTVKNSNDDSVVGRNKAIQARSARWRFRRIWMAFAGNTGSRYRSNQLIPAYWRVGAIKAIMLTSIAAFAAVHGLAHGSEMPVNASAYAYVAGIVSATAVLHLSGLALGWIAGRIDAAGLIHLYGAMTGLIGAWLLLA